MSEWSGQAYGFAELGREVADKATSNALDIDSPMVGTSGEAPAKASPFYLLSYEIVDIVELSAQYRAEEEAAAEEGVLIEASGMPDPQHEANGRW